MCVDFVLFLFTLSLLGTEKEEEEEKTTTTATSRCFSTYIIHCIFYKTHAHACERERRLKIDAKKKNVRFAVKNSGRDSIALP